MVENEDAVHSTSCLSTQFLSTSCTVAGQTKVLMVFLFGYKCYKL